MGFKHIYRPRGVNRLIGKGDTEARGITYWSKVPDREDFKGENGCIVGPCPLLEGLKGNQ